MVNELITIECYVKNEGVIEAQDCIYEIVFLVIFYFTTVYGSKQQKEMKTKIVTEIKQIMYQDNHKQT